MFVHTDAHLSCLFFTVVIRRSSHRQGAKQFCRRPIVEGTTLLQTDVVYGGHAFVFLVLSSYTFRPSRYLYA